MSSLAYAPTAARRSSAYRVLSDTFSQRGSDVLLAIAVIALAAVLLASLAGAFNVDSWLALVTGREIWQHGLPFHETLTALAHGKTWVDQQWLSQLASYALYRGGGLALLGIANVGLIVLGVAGAVVGARRLGANPRAVLLAFPLCAWLLFPSREIRTQEFVIPLFVLTVYLLSRDSRSPSARVYWCLPILVLWANLHGTVTIGVMLVAMRGLTLAWERRSLMVRSFREWRRPLALALGAPLCLLATPYGLGAISYYQTMLFGSTLRHTVTEWQPITSVPLTAAAFFLTAGIVLWSFGRDSKRTTLWERLVLIALIAGSIAVIRNALFFALCALVVLPVSLNVGPGKLRVGTRRARFNLAATLGAVAALLIACVGTFAKPASAIEFSFQRMPLLTVVERTTRADPSLKVMAEVRFADWLLWRDPALSGRVANDARFELLTKTQMNDLQTIYGALGQNWKQGARGFRLIVADRKYEPYMVQGFIREPGARVLYDDGERVVILRNASEAR